jgi:hypothetical protein
MEYTHEYSCSSIPMINQEPFWRQLGYCAMASPWTLKRIENLQIVDDQNVTLHEIEIKQLSLFEAAAFWIPKGKS